MIYLSKGGGAVPIDHTWIRPWVPLDALKSVTTQFTFFTLWWGEGVCSEQ